MLFEDKISFEIIFNWAHLLLTSFLKTFLALNLFSC